MAAPSHGAGGGADPLPPDGAAPSEPVPRPPGDGAIPRSQVVLPRIAEVHFDGACQPPAGGGVATYGFTVEGEGIFHEECGLAVRPWSAHATNNVAEYTAAIRALEWLSAKGFDGQVILLGDSQLVVRQMQGEYRVRTEHLQAYAEQLRRLADRFRDVRFAWVPREENRRADDLSKLALERAWAEAGAHRPSIPEVAVEDESPGPERPD